MQIINAELEGVKLIQADVHGDARGFFAQTIRADIFASAGLPPTFPLQAQSRSARGVLRGLHYQHPDDQAKIVRVAHGCIFDVVVDIRVGAPTFGQWMGVELIDASGLALFIPEGFAHGFCVLSGSADVIYHMSSPYAPQSARTIKWNDPEIGIKWPVPGPTLSDNDQAAPMLADAMYLPSYAG